MFSLKSGTEVSNTDTLNTDSHHEKEKIDYVPCAQDNTASVSNTTSKSSFLHGVTCQASLIDSNVTNCTVTPRPTVNICHVASPLDANLNLVTHSTEQSNKQNTDQEVKDIGMKPVALVCEPDILPCMKENVADIEKEPNFKINQKQLLRVRKRRGAAGNTKREKRIKTDKRALRRGKKTGQSPPKVKKKKPKQIRDLEKALNSLLSDNEQVKDEKALAFAQSYFLKVTETLHGKDDATYNRFMKTMNDFGIKIFEATELFKKVTKIFEKYPDLAEEFLAFLLPEQAMECGKFMEYIILTKMSSFCRKLEVYYAKQPSQLRKIYTSLASLAANNEATMDDLRNTIIPLLRHNSLLVNMFLELIPSEPPHASSFTDFECMDFQNVDLQNPKIEDSFETIEVPPPVEDNTYGGEDCICSCHLPCEFNNRRRIKHCLSCGTKFIDGRVYVHSGSMLRPAKLSFKENKAKNIERLCVKNPKSRQKIGKNQTPGTGNKKNSGAKGEMAVMNTSGAKSCKENLKGKANEDLKKAGKALNASKSSKKRGGAKKLQKPPRKKIKIMKSGEDTPGKQCTKAIPASKKNISKSGKGGYKVEQKCSKKSDMDSTSVCSNQVESGRRGGRAAGRSKTDSSQQSNRKQSGVCAKLDTSNVLMTSTVSVTIDRLSDTKLLLKGKNLLSLMKNASIVDEKEKCDVLNESESIAFSSPSVKLNDIPDHDCVTEDVQSDVPDEPYLSQNSETVFPDNSSEVFTDSSTAKSDEIEGTEVSLSEDLSLISKEATEMNDTQTVSEYNIISSPVQHNAEELENVEQDGDNCSQCTEFESDRTSPEHSAFTTQENKTLSYSNENLSCSEAEEMSSERMEVDTTDENITSEDDKNVMDLEDLHSDTSGESYKEDSQIDIDDFCDESESCASSPPHDSNADSESDSSGKGDCVALDQVGTSWTRDEDKIILHTFQSVNGSDSVFQKICDQLPNRTAEEVRLRFQALMSFLQKITGDSVLHN